MSFRVSPLVSLVLLSALVAAAGAAAAQGRGHDRGPAASPPGMDRGPAMPPPGRDQGNGRDGQGNGGRHDRGQDHRELSDAVRRVERRTGGQVLSAERVPFDGRDVNRVKVIDSSGRVRVYMDDPHPRPAVQPKPAASDPSSGREG